LAVDRLVSGSDAAKLTDGLYDPNLHLFADDLDIERTWDVSRVLGKPEPLPSAVIVPDKPWEKERRIWNVTGSVIYDPGFKKYRMWYAAVSPRAGDLNFPEYNCYAESEDGITWVKPDLNLYEYKGSKQNNIV